MDTLAEFADKELPEYIIYERLDMYCIEDDKLISLDEVGDVIE